MSGCGGNCSCGSSCKCGNGCGCGMYPDVEKNTTHVTIIEGVAPLKMYSAEESFGAEGGNGCKCGSSCNCDPCNFLKMKLKLLKWRLPRGSLMKRVVLRALVLVLALIVVSLMQMSHEVRVVEPIMSNVEECPFDLRSETDFKPNGLLNSTASFAFPIFGASPVYGKENSTNLTRALFKVLVDKNLLQSNARALCVSEGSSESAVLALRELGFFNAFGVDKHPFFSLFKRRFGYELDFEDNHFDFVFSGDLDRASVPALLLLEIERILRPLGTGAMLVGPSMATSVVSFLKGSNIVHACEIGPFTLVIFKKKNKPFLKYIEPLSDKSSAVSYLPSYMNISSRNKLVYINLGAGEFARASVAKMLKPYSSNHHSNFDVFIIDHETSVLTSYVTEPGITFIYDPALGGDTTDPEISSDEYWSGANDEEEFDFVRWFNETVAEDDFVVLMMNAKLVELNILVELYKTGAICHVDELFLRCSDGVEESNTTMYGDCVNLYKSLWKSGLYVHQWSGE
ncbi:hypothetical protein ACJIZ3_012559 [Penstemon smallii]|uniref:Metallothionein-like protein n=1 Tax=Penstemon smallii TaxID=265156 RepID=A0ABD3UNJ4_9LAMI